MIEHPRKLIFKEKVHKDVEQEPSPEKAEYSEKVAQEKLARIVSPAYTDFSVRFVNIGEYRHMLETGEMGGRGDKEVLYGLAEGVALSDFIPTLVHKIHATEWVGHSGRSVRAGHVLLDVVKEIEATNKDKDRNEKTTLIRTSILDFLQDRRLEIPNEDELWLGRRHLVSAEQIANESSLSLEQMETIYNATKDLLAGTLVGLGGRYNLSELETVLRDRVVSGELPDLVLSHIDAIRTYGELRHVEEDYGKERINVLRRLQNDTEYLNQPGALREVLTALTYMFDHVSNQHGQYNIALILDNQTFGFRPDLLMRHATWSSFYSSNYETLTDEARARGLVAAVGIMPLNDITKEMVNLDMQAGDLAHPVFHAPGGFSRLCWPV